ncbi:MAG: hypothetical protein WC449_01850 [Candidatus Paceibacterota bacterium]
MIDFNAFVTPFQATLVDSLTAVVLFLPKLILALLVAWIGFWIAGLFGKVISEIIKAVKFDKIFEDKGWSEALKKADIDGAPSSFIGAIIKWIFVIIFLVMISDILGLGTFSVLLKEIVAYLPNVAIASLLFVATVIITDLVEKVIVVSIGGMKVSYATAIGSVVKWAIWIFSIFAIMDQLRIAPYIAQTLFAGITYFFVLALGLAFGLGGKEVAGDILKDIRDKFRK